MNVDTDAILRQIKDSDPEHFNRLEAYRIAMHEWALQADMTGEIPEEIWSVTPVDLLNRINIPVAYGGVKMTETALQRAVLFERIGEICPSLPISMPGPGLSMPPVLHLGTEEQKRAYLQRFIDRDVPVWGAFAITEPDCGSDATALKATATQDGDDYILNGEKCFITNGARAEVVVVFANAYPSKGRFGIRAYVVPANTPGFKVNRCEDMLGLRSSQLTHLSFTECRVPKEYMLGHNGKRGPLIDAFTGAQHSWDFMRPVLSSVINGSCIGIIRYTRNLLQTNQVELTIAEREAVAHRLDVFTARCQSSRLMSLRAAHSYDQQQRASTFASIAKAFASTTAIDLAHYLTCTFPFQAMQKHNPIEKFYRDAKGFDILEGTGDMQRLMIAKAQSAA
ncbi:acyl-CoA dehydrogenase family protein [Gynuella sp.]|uniref:acyl-CoA dehydrogenase family protein n=1 Tax=Gynuella sp. TaxID=2969146 RepID=UPI003D150AC5